MNTIPPVAPTPSPSDPSQSGAASSTDSAPSSANSQNFAGALREAGGKPGHKTPAPKAASSHANGSDSPAVGNQLPPVQTPLPLATPPVTATIQSDAAVQGDAKTVQSGAPAIAALQDKAAGLESSPPPTLAGVVGGANSGNSPLPVPALPEAAVSSAATALNAAAPSTAASPAGAPVSASTSTPKIPAAAIGASAANSSPAAPGNGARDLEKTGQTDVASTGNASIAIQTTSAPTLTDDANSQAALAAAAAGVNAAPLSDSSPNKDNSATADSDAPANGALPVAPTAAATAETIAATSAKTAIAAVAATAASIAQLRLSDTRETSASDKNSRDSATDMSISGTAGTSNDGTAGAAQLLSPVSSPAPPTASPILRVAAGVDSAEFGQGVADRVSFIMGNNLTSAKLQVNPPALGPIEVRIALQAGHAQVWLTSHSAVTRDALESSSPKLREMLGAQGFGQVSVDISQRSFQERTPQPQNYEATPPADRAESISSAQPTGLSARTISGFLDAYA